MPQVIIVNKIYTTMFLSVFSLAGPAFGEGAFLGADACALAVAVAEAVAAPAAAFCPAGFAPAVF